MKTRKLLGFLLALTTTLVATASTTGCGEAKIKYQLSEDGTFYTVTSVSNKSGLREADIPAEIDGVPVTAIGDQAFLYCDNLTSVIMPDTITQIGRTAFGYCASLEQVTLSSSITAIAYGAFAYCPELKSLTLPEGITTIEARAFQSSGLLNIDLPATLTAIGSMAFFDCAMTDIYIPLTVTSIACSFMGSSYYAGNNHLIKGYYTDPTLNHISYEGTAEQFAQVLKNELVYLEDKTTIDEGKSVFASTLLDLAENGVITYNATKPQK